MKIKFTTAKLTTILAEIIGAMLIVFFSINVYKTSEEISMATTNKLEMLRTAFALQQSSEDLTKFAGDYVITSNPKYKDLFISISNIRSGMDARPALMNSSYWYLTQEDQTKNHKMLEPKSLESIIQSLPFTSQELALIEKSHFESEQLEKKERNMFKMVEENKKRETLSIYYSEDYHNTKVVIMSSLDELYGLLNERFMIEINELKEEQLNSLIRLFTIIFLLSVVKIMLPTTFRLKL